MQSTKAIIDENRLRSSLSERQMPDKFANQKRKDERSRVKLSDDQKAFERAMRAVWEELSDRYGQLFLSRYSKDWREAKIWVRVLGELPIEAVRAGFAKLRRCGMPKQGDFYDLSVDGFLRLCPSESDLLGLIDFEAAWAGIQFNRSKKAPRESLWMIRNAAEHGVIWEQMERNDGRGKIATRRMYGLLIAHVRNGGELPDISEKPAIERKYANPNHDAKRLTELGGLSRDEQWQQIREMIA